MEKSELKKLIKVYDDSTFYNLNAYEWDALTNHFDLELAKEVLLRVAECYICEPDEDIIKQQLEVLRLISNAWSNIPYDTNYDGANTFFNDAELSLQIRAGEFLFGNKVEIPTTQEKNPNYEALQRLVSDYSSACMQLKIVMASAQDKSKEDYNLLNTVNSQNEEIARLKKELESHKIIEKDLRTENEQLKMQQKELDQMSKKLVQKAEYEVVMKALRTYINKSKRKDVKKRGYIKMAIMELVQSARWTLPEDMQQDLEKFDDDNTDDSVTMNFNSPVGQAIAHADKIESIKEDTK